MIFQTVENCSICETSSLERIWELPKLPFTEKYGIYVPEKPLFSDQSLHFCVVCGHVQLERQISPKLLYSESEYAFRTEASKSAQMGCHFFLSFVRGLIKGRSFKSLLDIGGNDLYLAKLAQDLAIETTVADPICKEFDGKTIDNIKIFGRYIEGLNLKMDIQKPDIVFCRHVLEHIANPKSLFLKLFEECDEEALYVFEIPCFDSLEESQRFDAIFHQHYHYFSIRSLKKLIAETGGEYLKHAYNKQGSCGGSLVVAFQKSKKKPELGETYLKTYQELAKSIRHYERMMEGLSTSIERFKGQLYGYGASLMLATFAYHLKKDLSELVCVLDDDPQKNLMGYENLPVTVKYAGEQDIPRNSKFLVTSLENVRPITKRIIEFEPSHILVPNII